VDERRAAIVMEFVEGPTLRALANGLQPEERRRRFLEIGRIVGELHAHGVVHGDLTTSNVIVRGEGLVVIDFGLGFHSTGVEDQAVDLHLLERSIDATHYAFAKEAFSAVKEGYALVRPRAAEVFARIAQIERRRRYSSKGE
jgi:TP53 regulating kinase-like protein